MSDIWFVAVGLAVGSGLYLLVGALMPDRWAAKVFDVNYICHTCGRRFARPWFWQASRQHRKHVRSEHGALSAARAGRATDAGEGS